MSASATANTIRQVRSVTHVKQRGKCVASRPCWLFFVKLLLFFITSTCYHLQTRSHSIKPLSDSSFQLYCSGAFCILTNTARCFFGNLPTLWQRPLSCFARRTRLLSISLERYLLGILDTSGTSFRARVWVRLLDHCSYCSYLQLMRGILHLGHQKTSNGQHSLPTAFSICYHPNPKTFSISFHPNWDEECNIWDCVIFQNSSAGGFWARESQPTCGKPGLWKHVLSRPLPQDSLCWAFGLQSSSP